MTRRTAAILPTATERVSAHLALHVTLADAPYGESPVQGDLRDASELNAFTVG
jgi:hypothetical protein